MKNSGRSRWRKLDNAALAFPAATGKNDTRVFRFYCKLKEIVDGECLQQALDHTMEKYPLYQAVLRKGLFWFYMERRSIRAMAKKEDRPPCSKLYIPDQKSLLFEVSYYKDRINFEVFHALTDGTGALAFLRQLVKNYLQLRHPEAQLPDLEQEDLITGRDQEEDSFSQYYSGTGALEPEKKKAAYQLRGEKVLQDEMPIMEVVVSVREVLEKARAKGVSLTAYLAAVLLCAIHEEVPKRQWGKPVTLMVPVNLRNYFPSQSMVNFFGWIEVGYEFEENTTFDDVLIHVKRMFEKELVKDRIGEKMNSLVRLEKNPLLRAVPLEIKNLVLQAGTTLGGKSITAIYSNVGIIRMAEPYYDYIQRFGLFTSTDKLQVCSCSYGDELVLGLTSRFLHGNIQRNFVRKLQEEGITCKKEVNDFPGYGEKPRYTAQKFLKIFTFLCIAVSVVSGMVNYMMSGRLSWFWFVTAGSFCTWLTVAAAVKKWRNPLKSVLWQLVLLTFFSIFWDLFTGWRGWSVDYIFPLICLVSLCSMIVISFVRRMEGAEYLFYYILVSLFGWIPLLLVALHVVKTVYFSVLCSGVSFLFFVGLLIFRSQEVYQEFNKKFRM